MRIKLLFISYLLFLFGCVTDDTLPKSKQNSKPRKQRTKAVFKVDILNELDESFERGAYLFESFFSDKNGRISLRDVRIGDTIEMKFVFNSQKYELLNFKNNVRVRPVDSSFTILQELDSNKYVVHLNKELLAYDVLLQSTKEFKFASEHKHSKYNGEALIFEDEFFIFSKTVKIGKY